MSDLNVTKKSWGREELLYNDLYCCKLLVYTRSGIASSLHFHKKKTETFVITSGEFLIELGAMREDGTIHISTREAERYLPGDSITLPPLTAHRVRCVKPGVIVEASTKDDQADCVRLEPSDE